MDRETKLLAYKAIDENVEDTTARQVVRYVMECELWGQDVISPKRGYLAEKYGWSVQTEDVAISKAKASEFITTTGWGETRCFELNVGFLKGKMAEITSRITRPKLTLDDLLPDNLPKNSPKHLPKHLPKISPKIVDNFYGSTEPYNQEKGWDNNNNNNYNDIEEKEKNEYLGFPLPDNWQDDSFIDSEGNYIARIVDKFGRPIKASEIKERKMAYERSKKAVQTKKNTSDFAKYAVKALQEAQNIYKLDGGDNIKHAEEVKNHFVNHLQKDLGYTPKDDQDLLKQFRLFLERLVNHPFHGKNATSMGYIARNFNKITRELHGK